LLSLQPTKEALNSYPGFVTKTLALIQMATDGLTSEVVEGSEEPLIIYPEGESTNGEVGILAFSAVEIPSGVTIQPVAVKVSRVFMNTTCVGGSLFQEVLVTLICPNTHFSIR
jgi:hypothetical protein